MDQKLKNYSSGMQVRLAFSIAIKAQGDILLLDEVLAVGDAAFQQKCYDYFSDLKSSDKTIILVSHNMQAVERYCDRAILINNGEIKAIGNSSDIGIMYEDMFIDEEAERLAAERKKGQNNSVDVSDRKVSVEAVIVKQNEKITKKIKQGIDFSIEVTVEASEDVFNTDVGITIKDKDRFMLFDGSIAKSKGSIKLAKGEKYTVIFDLNNIFKRGLYVINVGVAEISKPEKPKMYARVEKAAEFSVSGESTRATISIPYFVNGKKGR
jgi:ABC-2 type transport system ATP-binding protein